MPGVPGTELCVRVFFSRVRVFFPTDLKRSTIRFSTARAKVVAGRSNSLTCRLASSRDRRVVEINPGVREGAGCCVGLPRLAQQPRNRLVHKVPAGILIWPGTH